MIKKIAALHVTEDGDYAAVWVNYDKLSDYAEVEDCCLFKAEVLPVVCAGLNARGRWIPIAWEKKAKAVSDELLDMGCNMLYDPIDESGMQLEVNNRALEERLRTRRLKVKSRLGEWKHEYKQFSREGGEVPVKGFPLMTATRHAVSQLEYAKRQATHRKSRVNYPAFNPL